MTVWDRIPDPIADSVNPALAIAALVVAVLEWRASWKRAALAYVPATALGLAGIYIVAAVDRAFGILAVIAIPIGAIPTDRRLGTVEVIILAVILLYASPLPDRLLDVTFKGIEYLALHDAMMKASHS